MASAYNYLGWSLGGPRIKERENAHRSAAALYEQLRAEHPDEHQHRHLLAHSYASIAVTIYLQRPQRQLSEAEAVARRALDLFSASESARGDLRAAAYYSLAQIQQAQGLFEKADAAYPGLFTTNVVSSRFL